MAALSHLPNEMITEIWARILEPRDIERFALVSKHIYALGKPFVDEHNKLKREYSLSETGPYTRSSAPAFLLKDVLLRPRVALYVTHLSIGRYQVHWEDPVSDSDDDVRCHSPYPDDDMALFIEAIRKASFVPRNEIEGWITSVREGNEDPILALLPLLLSNLTTTILVIQSSWEQQIQPLETIQRIAKAENRPFLTRLTTVNLHVELPLADNFMDWEWLNMSVTLPVVQSIHVKRLGSLEEDDSINYKQLFTPGISNTTELTFVDSGIGSESMLRLFESIKGLKRFSYVEPDERLGFLEPFWMRSGLLAHAKRSLESLRITASQNKEGKTLGTFHTFTALRELETNRHLLIVGAHLDKLADLLPASIEKFHPHTGDHRCRDSVPSLIESFEKAKLELLPKLRALTIRSELGMGTAQGDDDLIKTLEETCRDGGIELSVIAG